MKLIKLSAIDSTNDFLKELAKNQDLENFTAVTAQEQTKGRGQMGASWQAEKGKNLIMSVLVKNVVGDTDQLFDLNVAISVAISGVLEALQIPGVAIKWPNDILSDGRKIAGILIENRLKSGNRFESVIGIGLNVNQLDFSALPQASSLALASGREFDIDTVFERLMVQIQKNCSLIKNRSAEKLWQLYFDRLFKKDIPAAFENTGKEPFEGTITGVTRQGQLEIMLADKSIKTFGIKEVKLLY